MGADEGADLEVNMNFVELCEDSGSFPSMVRSYARKFGCVEGFPKRNFLKRLTNRSHKLKRVTKNTRNATNWKLPKPLNTDATLFQEQFQLKDQFIWKKEWSTEFLEFIFTEQFNPETEDLRMENTDSMFIL